MKKDLPYQPIANTFLSHSMRSSLKKGKTRQIGFDVLQVLSPLDMRNSVTRSTPIEVSNHTRYITLCLLKPATPKLPLYHKWHVRR
jgi:hypothetical protein